MKLLKYAAILPLVFSLVGFAQAQSSSSASYTVGVDKMITVPSGSHITMKYHLDARNLGSIIICADTNTKPTTSIEWVYKGSVFKDMLPIALGMKAASGMHIRLIDSGHGKIKITNEGNDDTNVACDYHHIR